MASRPVGPSLQRLHDSLIMETFASLWRQPGVSPRRLQIANEVRMWLRVVTIAELADEDGKHISPAKLNGMWRNVSKYNWPNQPSPTKKMWRVFKSYPRKTYCAQVKRHTRGTRLVLDRQLGPWRKTERHSVKPWSRAQDLLFHLEHGENETVVRQYRPSVSVPGTFVMDRTIPKIPDDSDPVQVRATSFGYKPVMDYRVTGNRPTPVDVGPVTTGESPLGLPVKIIAVSDGSMDPLTGRASFC